MRATHDFVAWCDGACEPNPGGWAVAAWVLETGDGKLIKQDVFDLHRESSNTNNFAEYVALTNLLADIRSLRSRSLSRGDAKPSVRVLVQTDSLLAVNQILELWDCHAIHLRDHRDGCIAGLAELLRMGVDVELRWIPREENTKADVLSKSLYDEKTLASIARREALRKKRR